MAIFTRRGDGGQTGEPDGTRVSKASALIEAYGALDEANSAIGLARVAVTDPSLDALLAFAQHRLVSCGAALATSAPAAASPEAAGPTPDPAPSAAAPAPSAAPETVWAGDTEYLERAIGVLIARSAPFAGFVLVGGSEAAARLHVARAVVRRAERRLVALRAERPAEPSVLAFVNRLSDALYAAARAANALDGVPEQPWDPCLPPPVLP
jgi:cob(I)alamin adenosyltransferase